MAGKATCRLEWYGDQVAAELKTALAAGLAEWAELHERQAKGQLSPGRGYLTGRMQRSIHAAAPDHNWKGDFKAPGRSAPELGNMGYKPAESGTKISVAVGSGLLYAAIQEGRLQFVQRAHDQTIGQLPGELEKAVRGAGFDG
jgi:hypothetical protein